MNKTHSCPALLVSAPASGHGKTTITAALARMHSKRGRKVRVFKCGPDFLDPMILERASGAPVYQLDLWIQGEVECRRLLNEAAAQADLILVEGVMGLYDGEPSAADLAILFGIPVLACIDASAMAGTFAALAHGLATFKAGLPFSGVFANRLGSARHADILRNCLPPHLRWYGCMFRDADIALPSRHLGLVQAEELDDLDRRLDRLADLLEANCDGTLPESVSFAPATSTAVQSCAAQSHIAEQSHIVELPYIEKRADAEEQASLSGQASRADHNLPTATGELAGLRIGIARDQAFSFIYQANLDLLRNLGAELSFFSPLSDNKLPEVDSLYFPGGYPELHLNDLAANTALIAEIRQHHSSGKAILAECGGMLYLLESLEDHQGHKRTLAGLIPGRAKMQKRLAALGSQEITLPEGTLRGHTFHHSILETELEELARGTYPASSSRKNQASRTGEAVYRLNGLTASYIHLYFPSNPRTAARLFKPQG
ncbi:cobyrinate a,c-diamide synthase [Desulfovibrio sp. OttesenSCG-928-C06]|nr:cobyrinate a,c-diamide synthase [Desulfovibrio sp. OttesenSCG-928-C06]